MCQSTLLSRAPPVRADVVTHGSILWPEYLHPRKLRCSEHQIRSTFALLALNDFGSLPRDGLWVTNLVFLSEVCAYLGDRERAAILYQLLRPYDGRNIVIGSYSGSLGAAARYLALLALTMSDWQTAERHFEDALAMNERMGGRPWLAHTQYEYGRMLLARGDSQDRDRAQTLLSAALETATDLGMASLIADIEMQNNGPST